MEKQMLLIKLNFDQMFVMALKCMKSYHFMGQRNDTDYWNLSSKSSRSF